MLQDLDTYEALGAGIVAVLHVWPSQCSSEEP